MAVNKRKQHNPDTGEFPAQRPVTRSFDVFFDLRLNGWVNNRQTGDLRRHRTHYGITLMAILAQLYANAH